MATVTTEVPDELSELGAQAGDRLPELEPLRCGIYEHYKGKRYLVLGVARHTETGELMAVYVPLYDLPGSGGVQMAVRPLKMFTEKVEVGPETMPRFRFIGTEAEGGK